MNRLNGSFSPNNCHKTETGHSRRLFPAPRDKRHAVQKKKEKKNVRWKSRLSAGSQLFFWRLASKPGTIPAPGSAIHLWRTTLQRNIYRRCAFDSRRHLHNNSSSSFLLFFHFSLSLSLSLASTFYADSRSVDLRVILHRNNGFKII